MAESQNLKCLEPCNYRVGNLQGLGGHVIPPTCDYFHIIWINLQLTGKSRLIYDYISTNHDVDRDHVRCLKHSGFKQTNQGLWNQECFM